MANEERPLRKPKSRVELAFWVPVLLICTLVVVLPLFGPKWFGSPESSQAHMAAEIDKTLLELNVPETRISAYTACLYLL